MRINAKITVLTGASKGVGETIASALIAKGALIYGLARSGNDLKALQKKFGKAFIPVPLDITDQKAVFSWVTNTFSDRHLPDILINNAGIGHFGNIDELSLEKWHKMIDTNINGLFYVTSQIVPLMKRHKDTCHIINMGSILGKIGKSGSTAYCSTKYGVRGFSEALFRELRCYKIKVSCINPGSIATNFFIDSGIEPNNKMILPKELADFVVHILETPDNLLIDEITLRPLIPG